MSKQARAQALEAAGEDGLMQELFAQEINHDPSSLISKESYVGFGKEVSKVLYEG